MATSEEKRWAKEARLRRQALKKAAMPPTNLFQARIRRTELNNRPRSHVWLWILFMIIGGGASAAWWMQHVQVPAQAKTSSTAIVAPTPDLSAALQASSAPVVAPVAVSIPTVVNSAVVASTDVPHAVLPDTREWHAPVSEIHDSRQVVVKSGRRWRALWQEMGHTDAAPRVNFYDNWIVGVFLGPKDGGGYEVQIDPAQETDDQVTVPYRVVEPLPGVPLSTEKTYPWQLRVISRTDKPLHFNLVSQATSGTSH